MTIDFEWTFSIIDAPPPVLVSPVLAAFPSDRLVILRWSIDDTVTVVRFELRRSTEQFPEVTDEGDLIYTGPLFTFNDTDVINNTRYFYTVFVVYDTEPDVYVPYDILASATAVPRAVVVARFKIDEYVPKRGEFGRTAKLMRLGTTTAVWGEITGTGPRLSDMITAPNGEAVLAPVTGTVYAVEQSEAFGLSDVYIDSTLGGFRFTIRNIKPLPTTVPGTKLLAGVVFARASTSDIEFAITKLATATVAEKTVRPLNYYLTAETKNAR